MGEKRPREDMEAQTTTTEPIPEKAPQSPKEPEKKKRRKNNRKHGKREQQKGWGILEYRNDIFEKYYSESNIIPAEEWATFKEIIKIKLPTTFRINTASPYAKLIRDQIENHIIPLFNGAKDQDGNNVDPPSPIPWYPERMAWHMNVAKSVLRKDPSLSVFHKFLIMHTEHGNISRQEAVSMLPPFFMDIEPHHRILDMCAAPGSKTAQLLEMLKDASSEEKPLTGFVVANDSDQKRCYLLVHQLQRLSDLFPHVIITNHDARRFPNLVLEEEGKKTRVMFDRVLCDVICSGDGTIRKSPNIWKSWNPAQGIHLHPLQTDIAMRGIQVLKPGGRIVYSTCSMNPLEDEAVVAELLRRSEGKLRLVDVSDHLTELKFEKGINTWRVMSKEGQWFSSLEECPSADTFYHKSMFPPTTEEAEWMHLDRCMRLLPHHGDTGGFFIAVLEKSTEAVSEAEEDEKQQPKEAIQFFKGKSPELDEAFSTADEEAKKLISEFYNLPEDFDFTYLLSRSKKEESRKLVYVSPEVSQVIHQNEVAKKWRIINAGVRVFNKSDTGSSCGYRVCQEGIRVIAPFLRRRKISVSVDDLTKIIDNEYTRIAELSEPTQVALAPLENGAVVFHTQGKIGNDIYVVGFRGTFTINRMVSKDMLDGIRFQLDPTYIPKPQDKVPAEKKDSDNGKESEKAGDVVEEMEQ